MHWMGSFCIYQADTTKPSESGGQMAQQCVLFDMDGTIYDSEIGIQGIRDKLCLPQDGRPILDQLGEQPSEVRDRGIALLHVAEADGAANGKLIRGTQEMLAWLRAKNVRCGLVTNNSRHSVETILTRHPLAFDAIVTREDATMKPAPDLFLLALEKLGCRASDAVAVGDTHLDGIAAHRAGIRAIYLIALQDWMTAVIPPDIAYKAAENLTDVRAEIEAWLKR